MQELYSIGMNDESIKDLLDSCPSISFLSNDEVLEKIKILSCIGCFDNHILNIIEANPWYLDRSNNDVLYLINKLQELGFSCLNILFDSNPFILNLDVFEIDNYINDRILNGEMIEDIVSDLESNPYIFNEM